MHQKFSIWLFIFKLLKDKGNDNAFTVYNIVLIRAVYKYICYRWAKNLWSEQKILDRYIMVYLYLYLLISLDKDSFSPGGVCTVGK